MAYIAPLGLFFAREKLILLSCRLYEAFVYG